MKIKQAPITDLLKYMETLYYEKIVVGEHKHILDIINQYYGLISKHKNILAAGNDFLQDWSDLNYNTSISDCPNVPGIIVYRRGPNNTRHYALLYHSGQIAPANAQTEFLSYFEVNVHNMIESHAYLQSEWEGWCAPTRYFYFNEDNYIDNKNWQLGERVLSAGMAGHDVMQLQSLLKNMHTDLAITGRFDDQTLKCLQETQRLCGHTSNNNFDYNTKEGKTLITFVSQGNKIFTR